MPIMASKSANPKNKLKRDRAAFKSASRTRSEECIWEIEGRTRFVNKSNDSTFKRLKFLLSSSRLSENLAEARKKSNHLAGKEFVRIITRDGVRDLLVPSNKPNSYSDVWPERELTRLQTNAKVLTVEDKMQELQLRTKQNAKLKEESEMRKLKLREIDIAKEAKLDDAKETFVDESENVKLLDRAYLARQERV